MNLDELEDPDWASLNRVFLDKNIPDVKYPIQLYRPPLDSSNLIAVSSTFYESYYRFANSTPSFLHSPCWRLNAVRSYGLRTDYVEGPYLRVLEYDMIFVVLHFVPLSLLLICQGYLYVHPDANKGTLNLQFHDCTKNEQRTFN